MVPTDEYPMSSKEATIWALAQQNPEFTVFWAQYQEKVTLTSPLSADFIDSVIEVMKQNPITASIVNRYLDNAQAAMTFTVSGLPEASILIASLFLLSTHIKFHRTGDGKWEFLVEHKASNYSTLEKIVHMLSDIFKK